LLPAWRSREPDVDTRLFNVARQTGLLLPAWERWLRAEHPVEDVRERGGIPVEWLGDGMESATLRSLLRELGISEPSLEVTSELMRQAARAATRGGTIKVRADESTVLSAKHGLLVATHSVFTRNRPS